MRWWTLSSFITLVILVHFSRAVDLKCTLSRSGKQVTSSLDKSLLPGNTSSCGYSWANGSVVLATHKGQHALVMKKSLDSLITSECFAELNWKAHCTSEKTGRLAHFTANCTSSCEQNELLHEDNAGYSALWILLLIPAVVALGYLLNKYKKKICSGSTPSCGQCGGLYTGVKTQDTDPTSVVVVVKK